MSLPPLPPYVYGREVAPNEKVWTESAVRELLAEGVRAGMEQAAAICEEKVNYGTFNGPRGGELCAVIIRAVAKEASAAKQGGRG